MKEYQTHLVNSYQAAKSACTAAFEKYIEAMPDGDWQDAHRKLETARNEVSLCAQAIADHAILHGLVTAQKQEVA